jgi:hypothetical protein
VSWAAGEWIRTRASDWDALPTVTCGLLAHWFGFSPFQLLIFDQQQIALAPKFIRFAKGNIALA